MNKNTHKALRETIRQEIIKTLNESSSNSFMRHFSNYKGTELYNIVEDLYMSIISNQVDPNDLADMILDLIDEAQRKEREDDYDY